VPKGENVKVTEDELDLGVGLIDWLTSDEFHPEKYEDEYRIRVLAMLDEKSKGQEITITASPLQRGGKVVDSMEALQRSLERDPCQEETRHDHRDKEETEGFLRLSTHSRAQLLEYPQHAKLVVVFPANYFECLSCQSFFNCAAIIPQGIAAVDRDVG
jgi:hypothetical protein